jgi:hypothetical protein
MAIGWGIGFIKCVMHVRKEVLYPRDFPPISPKIGEVQRNLDSTKTRFAVGFGPPMPILKNLKKQIDYLVYKIIILYLRYIATYNRGELYLGLNSGRFWIDFWELVEGELCWLILDFGAFELFAIEVSLHLTYFSEDKEETPHGYVQLDVTRNSKWGKAKDIVIVALVVLIGLVLYKSGTKLGIHLIMEGTDVWIISFKLGSQILALEPLTTTKDYHTRKHA